MQHISTTPFGRRPVSAGLLAAQALAQQAPQLPEIDKYTLQDDLRDARAVLGVTDRDLAVLAALLSFHKGRSLADGDDLVVYPSNRVLSQRAHGMAESTLRRHLAALVNAGLILRNDSANGKRYAARGADGAVICAYGFSLRLLLVRGPEIAEAARNARADAQALRQLRAQVTVALRDATKLVAYGQEVQPRRDWSQQITEAATLRRTLRRKLDAQTLGALWGDVSAFLTRVRRVFDQGNACQKTEKMNGSDVQNGRHYQNSKTDPYDFELCSERSKAQAASDGPEMDAQGQGAPTVPLALVRKACPDLEMYAQGDIRHWHHLVQAADTVRPMMGISSHAWQDACTVMGPETAAITVSAILQRMDRIHSPGGYLRALTRRAEEAAFSPGPMVMALLSDGAGQGARAG